MTSWSLLPYSCLYDSNKNERGVTWGNKSIYNKLKVCFLVLVIAHWKLLNIEVSFRRHIIGNRELIINHHTNYFKDQEIDLFHTRRYFRKMRGTDKPVL